MLLRDLIDGIYPKPLPALYKDYQVSFLSCDSREAQRDGLFVALPGSQFDGNDFIKDAVAQGARIVVKRGESRGLRSYTIPDDVCVLGVEDPKQFLRQVGTRFYGNPSAQVKTLAVTGTNGKTTVAYLLESILHAANHRCGVIGTVNHRIGAEIFSSKNTTPGFLDNQRYLAQLAGLGVEYCVMEVSSHALQQGRVEAIDFAAGIFTNLTQDHLDYHKDMESYFKAKCSLFTHLPAQAAAVVNKDDEYGRRLEALSRGQVMTYAIDHPAHVRAENIHYHLSGSTFDVVYPSGKAAIHTRFIGRHNVYNILAAFACAHTQGFAAPVIREGIESLRHVPGRLEPAGGSKDFFVFIDYAHTEDGLVNVLNALRAVSGDKIILVFGCGGDRDRGKRSNMGRCACALADYSVVTSDNPRSEDPRAIIDEIVVGFTKNNYEICVDRKKAIGRALGLAQKNNIVLIAGKGHEAYQVFKDRTVPFNERKIVEEFFA